MAERRRLTAYIGPAGAGHDVDLPLVTDPSEVAGVSEPLARARARYEGGTRVAELVPDVFEAHARVFHRPCYEEPEVIMRRAELEKQLESPDPERAMADPLAELNRMQSDPLWRELHELDEQRMAAPGSTLRTWHEIAAENGKIAHPQMEWHQISTPTVDDERFFSWGWEMEPEEVATLAATLRPFTATPDSCFLAIWEGYGMEAIESRRGSAFLLGPHEHLVFRGTLADASSDAWNEAFNHPPTFWWPEDRRWCVGFDIDFDTTFVGGSAELVRALVDSDELEALEIGADARVDFTGDEINGGGRA